MALARKVEESCPRCRSEEDVWMFEKREGMGIKQCYSCENCGCEWSKYADDISQKM